MVLGFTYLTARRLIRDPFLRRWRPSASPPSTCSATTAITTSRTPPRFRRSWRRAGTSSCACARRRGSAGTWRSALAFGLGTLGKWNSRSSPALPLACLAPPRSRPCPELEDRAGSAGGRGRRPAARRSGFFRGGAPGDDIGGVLGPAGGRAAADPRQGNGEPRPGRAGLSATVPGDLPRRFRRRRLGRPASGGRPHAVLQPVPDSQADRNGDGHRTRACIGFSSRRRSDASSPERLLQPALHDPADLAVHAGGARRTGRSPVRPATMRSPWPSSPSWRSWPASACMPPGPTTAARCAATCCPSRTSLPVFASGLPGQGHDRSARHAPGRQSARTVSHARVIDTGYPPRMWPKSRARDSAWRSGPIQRPDRETRGRVYAYLAKELGAASDAPRREGA